MQDDAGKESYDMEEVSRMVEKEAGIRVKEALDKARKEWDSEISQKIKMERDEYGRMAEMTEEEKVRAVQERREGELLEKERLINLREIRIEALNILGEKKLPATFADILAADTAERTRENIDLFEREFAEAVSSAVYDRLKGSTPQADATANTPEGSFIDRYNRAKSVAQRSKIKREALRQGIVI